MIIKKYIVNTIEEVQERINQELGPNAFILTSRQIRYKGLKALFFSNKVEVVAAIDENDHKLFEEMKKEQKIQAEDALENLPTEALQVNKSSDDSTKKIEGDTAQSLNDVEEEWESPMETLVEEDSNSMPQNLEGLEEPANYEASSIPGTYLDPRFNRRANVTEANVSSLLQQNSEYYNGQAEHLLRSSTLKELSEIKKYLTQHPTHFLNNRAKNESLFTKNPKDAPVSSQKSGSKMRVFLEGKGISPFLAETLVAKVENAYGNTEFSKETIKLLKKEVAALIPVYGPICLQKGISTIASFAGLSGSEKTTLIFQIATQYTQELAKSVGIISLGSEQQWRTDRLRSIALENNLSVFFAQNEDNLREALEANREKDLILIDFADFEEMDSLGFLLQGLGQTHFVVSATMKEHDACALLKKYDLKYDSLVLTKWYESVTRGSLLNLCQSSHLPISYITINTSLFDGLIVADPDDVAESILTIDNQIESSVSETQIITNV